MSCVPPLPLGGLGAKPTLGRLRCLKPLSQTNLLRRSLHPILQNLDVEKSSFHAFRRFRTAKVKTHHDQAAAAYPDDYKKPGTSLDSMARVLDRKTTDYPASERHDRDHSRNEGLPQIRNACGSRSESTDL